MELPPVFKWMRKAGRVADAEMLRTINCGIGMVLVTDTFIQLWHRDGSGDVYFRILLMTIRV